MIPQDQIIGATVSEQFFQDIRQTMPLKQVLQWQQRDKDRSIIQGLPFQKKMLYIPSKNVQKKTLQWCHTKPLAGHPGTSKTQDLVQRHFWWPTWRQDTVKYVQQCDICSQAKVEHGSKKGLLQPLPTPTHLWEDISMNFITDLPKDQGKTTILVVVDRLSKMAHFIACDKIPTATQLVTLLVQNVVKLHGLPRTITSDREAQLTSKVWKAWCETLQIKSNMSTSFHPESDGQTERVNQVLKQYLRCYVFKQHGSGVNLLWEAEFAYNNLKHASINISPFFANHGCHPHYSPLMLAQPKPTYHL